MSVDKPLGLSARIRNLIRTTGRPMRCGEIQAAFPGENVPVALGAMYRSGQLKRDGEYRHYAYSVAKSVRDRRANLTDAERREAKNARDRRAYAAMSPERHAEYLERKYARRPKPAAKPKAPPNRGPSIAIAPCTTFASPPPKVAPVAETVEQFLARGGQVDVLPGVGWKAAA